MDEKNFFDSLKKEIKDKVKANAYEEDVFLKYSVNLCAKTEAVSCYYENIIDGYFFEDKKTLCLVKVKYNSEKELHSANENEVIGALAQIFELAKNASEKPIFCDIEESFPEHTLFEKLYDKVNEVERIKLIYVTNEKISQKIPASTIGEREVAIEVWGFETLFKEYTENEKANYLKNFLGNKVDRSAFMMVALRYEENDFEDYYFRLNESGILDKFKENISETELKNLLKDLFVTTHIEYASLVRPCVFEEKLQDEIDSLFIRTDIDYRFSNVVDTLTFKAFLIFCWNMKMREFMDELDNSKNRIINDYKKHYTNSTYYIEGFER